VVVDELGSPPCEGKDRAHVQGVGHGTGMVATHWGTHRPWRHFVDYVAGSKVDRLELLFGPAMGQIWIWASYESSFCDALQFLFKDPNHWSNGLGSN
jgi:hypothetical protein